MPDTPLDLSYIDLSSFWFGIHSGWHGAEGQPVQVKGRFGRPVVLDGAAQDETFGCVGSPEGGLIPGPRLVRSYTEPSFTWASDGTFSPFDSKMVVTGFSCISPVRFDGSYTQSITSEFTEAAGDPPDVLVATFHAYVQNFAQDVSSRVLAVLYKFFMNPVQSTVLGSVVSTATLSTISRGWGGSTIGRSVIRTEAATDAGNIQVAALLADTPAAGSIVLYPNMLTFPTGTAVINPVTFDGVVSTRYIRVAGGSPAPVSPILVHQGRLVYLSGGSVSGYPSLLRFGANTSISSPERVTYSAVNDWLNAAELHSNVFVEDSPFGIGAIISVNASELLAIKQLGGGYVVRGDLDNPQIVHLPSLASTGIARNIPVACPIGVVYGSNRGVWLWSGSDVSTDLAPQLDGWFWKPGDLADNMAGEMGSFAYSHPYVFAPNNWIYDTRTQAWWRYGNPSERLYAWNSPSASGEMLCGPLVIDADNSVLCDWFDPTQGGSFYHYLSHPLQRTKGQLSNFRRMRVTLQGEGVVTITLIGLEGATEPEEFHLTDSSRSVSFSRGIDLDAQDVCVQIDARSTVVGQPAPTVWRASFGFNDSQGIDDAS